MKHGIGRLLVAAATVVGATAVLSGGAAIGGAGVAGADPTCSPAGSTGLTAAVVATTGQAITGPVDATGCDVGIYVGHGVTGVTVGDSTPGDTTVENANGAGILAENTSDITVKNSIITGNGAAPPPVEQAFGISLFGVSDSTVTGNSVTNNGRGGIGVMDYGPIDVGALPGNQPGSGQANVPSNDDTVSNNTVSGAYRGCAIVLAVFNTGNTMQNDSVTGNTVTGSVGFGPLGPDVGGIVVQSNGPGSTIGPVSVDSNTVTDSNEAGIIVHAAAPQSKTTDVSVTNNTVTGSNNWGLTNGPTATTGVIVSSGPLPANIAATNDGTAVTGNTISGQFYGIWSTGPNPPTVSDNTITVPSGGSAFYVAPAPGSGYWEAASDGGVFSFGSAMFHGSMGGQVLNQPVVGLATTEDQGGYWEVAADGGIFNFGDAVYEGSMGGTHLNQPVVGIAATPYVAGAGGAPATPGGLGYWEVASDGGIFNFGDANFYGSMGGTPLNQPVVGIATTPDGKGYWEVANDGGIFSFGDANYYGSEGGTHLNQPVVSIIASPTGHGYWVIAKDGGVFTFGDAVYFGSMGDKHLNKPIVASAGIGATVSG